MEASRLGLPIRAVFPCLRTVTSWPGYLLAYRCGGSTGMARGFTGFPFHSPTNVARAPKRGRSLPTGGAGVKRGGLKVKRRAAPWHDDAGDRP